MSKNIPSYFLLSSIEKMIWIHNEYNISPPQQQHDESVHNALTTHSYQIVSNHN